MSSLLLRKEKQMTAYAINFKNSTIRAFTSTSVASKMGNGLVVFTSAEDLLANRNTTGRGLVEVYNNNSDKPVKKFADNRTGAERILKLARDIHIESTPFDYADKPAPADRGAAALWNTTMGKKKKPRGAFAGKKIKCLVDVNPRKEGTRGWKNFSLFLENGTISYEDFVKLAEGHGSTKGGCREDLAHDIKKGRVELL